MIEYKTVTVRRWLGAGKWAKDEKRVIEQMAAEGWELMQVVQPFQIDPFPAKTLYFKRQKGSQPEG